MKLTPLGEIEAGITPKGKVVFTTMFAGISPGEFEEHEVVLEDSAIYSFVCMWLTGSPLAKDDPRLKLVQRTRDSLIVRLGTNRQFILLNGCLKKT